VVSVSERDEAALEEATNQSRLYHSCSNMRWKPPAMHTLWTVLFSCLTGSPLSPSNESGMELLTRILCSMH